MSAMIIDLTSRTPLTHLVLGLLVLREKLAELTRGRRAVAGHLVSRCN